MKTYMSKKRIEKIQKIRKRIATFDTSYKTNDITTMKEKENNQGRSAQYALKAIKAHYENLRDQGVVSQEMYEEAMEIHGAIVKAFIKREFGVD